VSFWPAFQNLLRRGSFLVAHNAPGERAILKKAFPLADFRWIDTLTVARALFPEEEAHDLPTCIGRFPEAQCDLTRICPDLTWHDALYDATASLCFLFHAWRGPLHGRTPQQVQNLPTTAWKEARTRRKRERAASAAA
jgi:DNA polymerase III epsilon subunit-like protein